MAKILEKNPLIYVDTGDTLFPSATIPKELSQSLSFAAKNLAKGLDDMGLTYFVPGDQDFAMGVDFLRDLAKEVRFHFLISNGAPSLNIKHKKWAKLKKGPHEIFLLGVLSPSVLKGQLKTYFSPIASALPRAIKELKKNGYSPSNPFHRLVVLSHAGMGRDERFAKAYPEIDWFIGAHSQSFTRYPRTAGKKTRLVQVLSRNHHLGEVKITLSHDRKKDSYALHEIREGLEKSLKPNPFTKFIADHKRQMSVIQQKEQAESMGNFGEDSNAKFATAQSCVDCHEAQIDKWASTAHSLAYTTLMRVKEENNLQCIKCHAVGTNSPKGFKSTKEMVQFADVKDKAVHEKKLKAYWRDVKKAIRPTLNKSVRRLPTSTRSKLAKKWVSLDESHGVSHNFANVQCLNCHTKDSEHPFSGIKDTRSPEVKMAHMKNKCLSCHDPDQSPSWYQKKSNGLPGDVDEATLMKMIKKVACPKIDNF
jgi:hypothetical protein